MVTFASGDFRTAQAAGHHELDSLDAVLLHRAAHRLLQRAAEADALLKLGCDILCNQLRVRVGITDLHDVDAHVLAGRLLDLFLDHFDARATLADEKAGASGEDAHGDFARRAIDLDARNAGLEVFLLHEVADFAVFDEKIGEILLGGVPAGVPVLDDANAEPVRINFLTHCSFPPYFA
ncbi:hypothetical protein SDC9_123924 [bioreactor metagenome]|uniref:Uncharacterized protein n=1 Tax=bioreactor metagenome TaxID=1076179 RepID=A0A645CIZ7_9ZZZZ